MPEVPSPFSTRFDPNWEYKFRAVIKSPQINFQISYMSKQDQKQEIESLSSLSMEHNLRELGASNLFKEAARKSSFDFVNVFKDSAHFDRKQLKNSLDLLSSNVCFEQKNLIQPKEIFKYDQKQKTRLHEAGIKPIEIGEVISDSEQQSPPSNPTPVQQSQTEQESYDIDYILQEYKPNNYLPPELEQILRDRDVPLEYVKGLLLVKDNSQVKSVRRLKVERYLEKRRNKTWNRKICYNCRQKVAQERLRIKGKFIKKRRAMELLGLTKPIPMVDLKKLLEYQLKDKTHAEIEQLIRKR